MGNPRHRLGERAEAAAATWLASAGWRILERRWRVPEGELDLVAVDLHGTLVGIEVRARRGIRAGSPLETVDGHHLRRLRVALARYAVERAPPHHGTRIDLVTFVPDETRAGSRWRATRLPGIDGW
jgi:putative endonuclease